VVGAEDWAVDVVDREGLELGGEPVGVRHGCFPFVSGVVGPVGVWVRGPAGWRGQPRRARDGGGRGFGPGESPARSALGIHVRWAETVTRPADTTAGPEHKKPGHPALLTGWTGCG
jgi:hypothetical protein